MPAVAGPLVPNAMRPQVTGWYDASATSSEPASPLDVACIELDGAVDAIKEAEMALLHKTQWLAAKTHDLDSVEWHVSVVNPKP